MVKSILVCLDGSEQDQQALNAALWLAKRLKATLHGLHIKDVLTLEAPIFYEISGALSLIPQMNLMDETRKAIEERAKAILSNFQKSCEERGISYKTYLEEGIVHKIILEKSGLHDLTILGRRGLNYKFDRDLLGSTADRVIRRTQSPTLVITHQFAEIKSPLVAYDGSVEAKEALTSAVKILELLKLPLTILNVGDNEGEAKRLLNEAKEYLDPRSLLVKYDWQQGIPRQVIPEYAKVYNHDLLILGARGDRMVDLLLGSSTLYALWQGGCHVLVDR